MKQLRWALIVLLAISMTNCNDDNEDDPIINKNIVINELMPKNTHFGQDENGEFDDWIELINLSDEDVDLTGYYLTDSKKNLSKWQFPEGTIVEKNGYLIVWADGDSTTQAGLHTNYKLSSMGENVLLVAPNLKVIDLVECPATELPRSYARMPNGTGTFVWAAPTINAQNKEYDPNLDINNIVINEVMPKNTQYGQDQNGQFDDWIELYNLSNKDINISGFYLNDGKKNLTKWKLPDNTILQKNGYLIVWADGDSTTQVGLHTNYKLSALGENITLVSPDLEIVDLVEYPEAVLHQSYARMPNGTGDLVWTTPTWNAENK